MSEHWPLFGLVLRTPRLELRYVDDADASALMSLARDAGVHDPGWMPFLVPWTRAESPARERQGLQFYWRLRAALTPQDWELVFSVRRDGELVGVQGLGAKDFAVTREVSTGSWLALPHQGKGTGKEMRAAVLALAFGHLGATRATSSAFVDNASSLGVSRALGYVDNGTEVVAREGVRTVDQRLLLTREAWRDDVPVTVEGIEACSSMLLE